MQSVLAPHPLLRRFQRLSLSEQSPHDAVRDIRSFRLHLCIGRQGTPKKGCIASTEVPMHQPGSTIVKRPRCINGGCIGYKTSALHQQRLHCTNRGGLGTSTSNHRKRAPCMSGGCIPYKKGCTASKRGALHQQRLPVYNMIPLQQVANILWRLSALHAVPHIRFVERAQRVAYSQPPAERSLVVPTLHTGNAVYKMI